MTSGLTMTSGLPKLTLRSEPHGETTRRAHWSAMNAKRSDAAPSWTSSARSARVHQGSSQIGSPSARFTSEDQAAYRGLLAGRTVHRPACVTGAPPAHSRPTASRTASRRRRPADEETQCPISGALLRALAHHLRMNRSEHGATGRIHHGHHDLGFARGVEHDSVELWAAAGDLDEFASTDGLHRYSVPGDVRGVPFAYRETCA
jgi:hypothetical protein